MKTTIIVLDYAVRDGNVFIHANIDLPDWDNFDDWLIEHGYEPNSVEWMAGDLHIEIING